MVAGECLHALIHEAGSIEAKAGAVYLAARIYEWRRLNGIS